MSGGETPTGRAGSGRGGTPGRVAAMGAMGGKPAEGSRVCVCVKHRNLAEQLK